MWMKQMRENNMKKRNIIRQRRDVMQKSLYDLNGMNPLYHLQRLYSAYVDDKILGVWPQLVTYP